MAYQFVDREKEMSFLKEKYSYEPLKSPGPEKGRKDGTTNPPARNSSPHGSPWNDRNEKIPIRRKALNRGKERPPSR